MYVCIYVYNVCIYIYIYQNDNYPTSLTELTILNHARALPTGRPNGRPNGRPLGRPTPIRVP